MAYKFTEVTAGGQLTEIEYIQTIVDAIVGIDSRITCNTTAAAQYSDSSATATFDFNIDGKYFVRLKRGNNNASQTQSYKFSIIVNEVEYVVSSGIRFWSSNTSPSGYPSANAHFKVAAYTTDNDIFLWIGANYNGSVVETYPTNYASALITDENDIAYCGAVIGSNDLGAPELYKCSDGSSGFALVKPLAYTESVGNISIVDNCFNPISSSGAFSTFTKDLIACSTVTIGSTIIIDGKTYIAVSSNILIEEV